MSSSVSTNNKIILGIDPGFGRVGWGVVEYSGGDIKHLAHGCIETNTKDSFVDRLVEIQKDLETIINKYQPEIAGVEDLFFLFTQHTCQYLLTSRKPSKGILVRPGVTQSKIRITAV